MRGFSGMTIDIDRFWRTCGQVPFEDVFGGRHSNFDTVFIVAFDLSVPFAGGPKIDVFVAELFLQEFLQGEQKNLRFRFFPDTIVFVEG